MFYLCHDLLEMIGENVKKIRDETTIEYHCELWNNIVPSRGWNSIIMNDITNREINHCFLEIIGSNFIVDEDGSKLSLKEMVRMSKLYDRIILNTWYNYKSWILNGMSENSEDILTFYRIRVYISTEGLLKIL